MAILEIGLFKKYRTIAEAIYMANSGDILLIDEGVYKEQIYLTDKVLHLVGNTHYPELGKVLIYPPNETTQRALNCSNISGINTVYIEGINFKYPTNSTVPPIYISGCSDVSFIFNRCIIDASTKFAYLFDSNVNGAKSISLNYCRLIWKDDISYDTYGERHFEIDGRDVKYYLNKCICSNSLEKLDSRYISLPLVYGDNELSIANTTVSGRQPDTSFSYMFDNYNFQTGTQWNINSLASDDPSYPNGLIPGEVLIFHTDFGAGNEKSMLHFQLRNISWNVVGGLAWYASNDGINWDLLSKRVYTSYEWSFIRTTGTDLYRYYRLYLTYTSTYPLKIMDYVLAEADPEYMPLDYALYNKLDYGPSYGQFEKYTPSKYYIKGTITDNLSKHVVIDDVVFNPYNKGDDVVLTNGDLVATLTTAHTNEDQSVVVTKSKKTGKWYFEFKSHDYTYLHGNRVGIGLASVSLLEAIGGMDGKSWGYELTSGNIYYNNELILEGPPISFGGTLGVALDLSNGKVWFSADGTWLFNGSPSTGINPAFTVSNIELMPMASLRNRGIYDSVVELVLNPDNLIYPIPKDFISYSSPIKWKVNYFNTANNDFLGYVYSEDDGSYYISTTYSGAHFIVCEDAASAPSYNDLLYSNVLPKELI